VKIKFPRPILVKCQKEELEPKSRETAGGINLRSLLKRVFTQTTKR